MDDLPAIECFASGDAGLGLGHDLVAGGHDLVCGELAIGQLELHRDHLESSDKRHEDAPHATDNVGVLGDGYIGCVELPCAGVFCGFTVDGPLDGYSFLLERHLHCGRGFGRDRRLSNFVPALVLVFGAP